MPRETYRVEADFSGDEEEEYSAEEQPLSDNEEDLGQAAEQQELTEQEIKEAAAKIKRGTERQLKALAPPEPKVQVKTKDIFLTFEGKLNTLHGDGLDMPKVSLKDKFGEHVGQLLKVEAYDINSTFPCTLAMTIRGGKVPEPTIEVADSNVKAHLIIPAKQVKSKAKTLFESAVNLEGNKKSVDPFEKKYAGVNTKNMMTKGFSRPINGKKMEVFADFAPLRYYLELNHKTTIEQFKKGEFEDSLCQYVPSTDSFVMDKNVVTETANHLATRLGVAKSAALNELEVAFDRARVSETCKEDRWTDSCELSHYAPKSDALDRLLEQPQKCEMMLRMHYL